ncbi:MAG: hypothetical protein ACI9C1_003147 [Candidatus Aldehydirespiratoraceae bacterium]|jgi:uncharacterized protein (DUF1330 family)
MTTRFSRFLIPVLFLSVVASSCSDDSNASSESSPTTSGSISVSSASTVAPTTTAVPATTVDPPSIPGVQSVMVNGAGPTDAFDDHLQAVANTDEDGPFYMVNLLDFAEIAHYPDDSEFAGSTGLEANERYDAASSVEIAAVGGELVFAGSVNEIVIGDGIEWDLVAIVRYPSRQSILDLRANEEFGAAVVHKWASLDHTFALVTDEIDLGPAAGLPPVDPANAPYPPTGDDAPFTMFHLINFHDTAQYEDGEAPDDAPISGREAVGRYSANAGVAALPLGIRPSGWFDVIVPAIGDGRQWDEARLNPFPSRETFEVLTSDPTWAEGTFHRSAGIEETYAIMLNPMIWRPELVGSNGSAE